MRHRGPDGAGLFRDRSGRCLLGHRRLAIIDLTNAAAQPMTSDDGHFTIVFNGEIYNYLVLREELEAKGVQLRTHSDTEVVLQLFRRDGPGMISRLRGMFAFAVWNSLTRSLFLARDPHGIKPLYYSDDGTCLRFASSLRALSRRAISRELNPAAIIGFLAWGSVPEPLTIYRSIQMVPAGYTMYIDDHGRTQFNRYWSLPDVYAGHAQRQQYQDTLNEDARHELLDSVKAHLVADVPVGVFLSSGIDSSVLVGLASEAREQPIHAVTLAFEEFRGTDYDEAPLAQDVARHYKAQHSIVTLSAETVRRSMSEFFAAMDQPTIDGLNVYWISKAVHETGLKAVLSGIGGDELFGGYQTFRTYPRLRSLAPATRVPGLHRATAFLAHLGPSRRANKVRALASALASPVSTFQLIRGLFTPDEVRGLLHPDLWQEAGGTDGIFTPAREAFHMKHLDSWRQVAVAEQCVYMRNQLLRDADWASMSHSLEVRVPFVDSRLTQSLGPRLSGLPKEGKSLLARSVLRPLPRAVVRRKKTGFSLPMQKWVSADIQAGKMLTLPNWLLSPAGTREVERLQSGVIAGKVHWSRVWALHCLGNWIQAET